MIYTVEALDFQNARYYYGAFDNQEAADSFQKQIPVTPATGTRPDDGTKLESFVAPFNVDRYMERLGQWAGDYEFGGND